jgi:hypothetical protein
MGLTPVLAMPYAGGTVTGRRHNSDTPYADFATILFGATVGKEDD